MPPVTVVQALEVALQHHQAGRLGEAESLYRQILAVQPQHTDALHLLGVVAHQAGRSDLAVDLISQAATLCPGDAAMQSNLAEAYRALGRLGDAVAACRRAIQLDPSLPDAPNNLGNALRSLGHLPEAIAAFQQAIALSPENGDAYFNLGAALRDARRPGEAITAFGRALDFSPQMAEAYECRGLAWSDLGRLDEAVADFRRALHLQPGLTGAHCHLGDALNRQGRLEEAIAAFQTALRAEPKFPEAQNNLGTVYHKQGRLDEAIAAYRAALALKPDFAGAHSNLGAALKDLGKLAEAVTAFRAALHFDPRSPEAHNNLGNTLADQGNLDGAIVAYRAALALRPEFAAAVCNLARTLADQGQLVEAIAGYRRAIQLDPEEADAHSNLLLTLHYPAGADAGEIYREHLRWNEQHARPLSREIEPHAHDSDPDRRLRIGYVSPDFRSHSVAFFLENLLAHHDPAQVEVFCYADLVRPDAVTARLRAHAAQWRDTTALDDAQMAALVRQDCIDLLVDLAGHTARNRLLVFARKPAPVQVSYLGYCDTTGLDAMDCRLTDAHADPPGTTEHLHSEELIRLPDCAWCYRPPEHSPPLGEVHGDVITFGAFNTLRKVNDEVLACWAKILIQLPGSRLLIKSLNANDQSTEQRVRTALAAAGVNAARVEFLGRVATLPEHLRCYQRVDVALDTFPYHGTTTTCEALWMGVPVITLAGKTHASRVGVSLLHAVGLPELIAHDPAEYVRLAVQLGADEPRRGALRASLRERMAASPLTDGATFARKVEQAYRDRWRVWCGRGASQRGTPAAPGAAAEPARASASLPGEAEAHNDRGTALQREGRFDEAIVAYRQALTSRPDYAEASSNLGTAWHQTGRLAEAIAAYRRAIELQPALAGIHFNLGQALKDHGETSEAIAAFQRALDLQPDYIEAHNGLGNALLDRGQADEAIAVFTRALHLGPENADVHNNLGNALVEEGRYDEAKAALRRALELRPAFPAALNNLGNALKEQGHVGEAVAAYRRAIELQPGCTPAGDNLLLSLHYLDDQEPAAIFREHGAWGERHAAPLARGLARPANDPSPERRLRIGYVSPDFREHPVAFFIENLLSHHDRGQVEVFCYANDVRSDLVTHRLRAQVGSWREIAGMTDRQVAELVRSDQIDILVDLAGHTARHRLLVFALQPAPVQVSYLGYCDTTGLRMMDYRLTDTYADPPGTTEHLHTEELVRLPASAWCFRPAAESPPPGHSSGRDARGMTLGSFNTLPKITDATLGLWSEILRAAPGSRLLIKNVNLHDRSVRERVLATLERSGVARPRVEMRGRVRTLAEHLGCYPQADLALDTFPYHGTTTTCEALWMGVPVITLAGRTHAARVGVSLLSNVGLPELIAGEPAEYVRLAAELIQDRPRLTALRASLRERMAASPLMDGPRFARNVEQAYRQMWRTWCAKRTPFPPA